MDNHFLTKSQVSVNPSKSNAKQVTLQAPEDSVIYRFNLLIDLTYDLLLADSSYRGEFSFDVDTSDQVFRTWYLADNVYRQALKEDSSSVMLKELRTNVAQQLQTFSNIDTSLTDIGGFYKGIKKSNFQNFTLTVGQYNSLKYIFNQFIQQIQNHTQNNIVAETCKFLLNNTLVQYATTDDGTSGYLYMDVESVISALSSEFADYGNKGLGVYLVPFFSIGANHAYFVNNNQLGQPDAMGSPTSLDNVYFASEKIGFKYKLWNWGYTHSFDPGINYKYYGKSYSWVRPQPTPTITDLHLMVYGSGILYNLANLKSDEGFNSGFVGSSLGVTFFNKLSMHAGLGMPFSQKQFKKDNLFFTFGFDIPISEYISAVSSK